MKIVRLAAELLGWFICFATLLPFIRTDDWWIRVFDFPRAQLFLFGLLVLLVLGWQFGETALSARILFGLLIVSVVIQTWHIVPYTFLARKQVKSANGNGETVRVLVANVWQENRNHRQILDEITHYDPDLVLLTEVDEWWTEQMRLLEKSYPHRVYHPRTNTYGMNLYSRFDLLQTQVRFLTDPEVPSIRTQVRHSAGRLIHFYGVHPHPPGFKEEGESERKDSEQRDAELVVVAKEVARLSEPVIVAGDFNDVAWSHTTRLFQRTSRLLDPRVGRGMFNSYHAKVPLFRYPLDHLFHSDHFTLLKIERLEDFGSDHFPIFVALRLEPEAERKQEAPPPKEGDRKEAEEILERRERE